MYFKILNEGKGTVSSFKVTMNELQPNVKEIQSKKQCKIYKVLIK